jgi:hypothetical protein
MRRGVGWLAQARLTLAKVGGSGAPKGKVEFHAAVQETKTALAAVAERYH